MEEKGKNIFDILESCPINQTIGDNLVKAWHRINTSTYLKPICAVSGGVIQI